MAQRSVLTSVIAAGAALALLTGCAPEPNAPETSAAVTTAPPSTAPSTTPTATQVDEVEPTNSPVVLPSCSELLPIDTARAAVGTTHLEQFEPSPVHKEYAYAESFGPVAIEALDGAEQVVQCSWGYPNSDGVATVFVAKLSPDSRERLVTSLRDSVFVERQSDQALIFEDHDPNRRKSMAVSYGFVGDVWVTHIGRLPLFEPLVQRTAELNLG